MMFADMEANDKEFGATFQDDLISETELKNNQNIALVSPILSSLVGENRIIDSTNVPQGLSRRLQCCQKLWGTF